MKKLIICLTLFLLGVISCSFYYAFVNSQKAFVMVVDLEQCDIHKVKIEIDNKNIYVEKTPKHHEIVIMFYTGSYPYSYRLTAFTKKCGNITSEIRQINDGSVFYERIYKDKIEHEIRAWFLT